ncbi:uncharacterized protein WCC33_006373 [Rhinophrynus dorsalis]
MSYRVCNGYVSLPSRYSTGGSFQHYVDSGRRSPYWVSKDLGGSRHGLEPSKSFGLSELERNIEAGGHIESDFLTGSWKDYSRSVSPRQAERTRSVSPIRGVHSLECSSKQNTEYARNQSSPSVSRRHSLSRLPSFSPEEYSLDQTLSHRGWSGSETDLRASLTESAQKRADLVQRLKDAHGKLEGQSEELRKRDKELELSRAKIELLALKQKQLETSISQLEKEKGWLEVSRYEDKKQRGELQDRIINLELEVMKAKSTLENLNFTNVIANQKTPMENNELSRDLRTARENLLYFRNRVKVLEAEKNQAVEELRTLREGSHLALSQTNNANQRVTDTLRAQQNLHEELAGLQVNFNTINLEKELLSSKVMRLEEKVSDLNIRLKVAQTDRERFLQEKQELHRRNQELSLELERAQRGREGFNDQVSDLHIELVGAKAQANRQDQEKVQMKEELVMLKQVNEKLTTELGQTQQLLQGSLDELHQIQAEQKINSNLTAALEAERAQLLGEKQLLIAAVEADEESQKIQELRSSQAQLMEEKETLSIRCHELEASLEQAHEQLGSQIQEQQQVTMYWKERWQQAAVTLKTTEEELEQATSKCQRTASKNAELQQDCEMLQADTEELSELRVAVSSLKKENEKLKQQIKVQEQIEHLQHLQSNILSSKENLDSDKLNSQLVELYAALQQANERIKEFERERSEQDLETRKLNMESGSLLQIELNASRQQLELERSRGAALQARIGELESRSRVEHGNKQDHPQSLETWSPAFSSDNTSGPSPSNEVRFEIEKLQQQLKKERDEKKQKEQLIFTLKEELQDLKHKKPGDIKASLEEVDSELLLVREELHKVWDMLRIKDTELEEQHQELESARGQYTECSTEKMRLEQLVATLQQQMAEKEQTVRHLEQMREMEKTEMDIERSSMELKVAEMQAQKENVSSQPLEQINQVGMKRWDSNGVKAEDASHKCARCEAFLQQLDKTIKDCQGRNIELQEEKSQILTSLYHLQEILKDLSIQTKVNEQVANTLQVDNETLKKQHRKVTEQLKTLFKEKENLSKAYRKLPKEGKPTDDWSVTSRLVKNVLSSIKGHEKQQEKLGQEKVHLQEELHNLQEETRDKDIRSLQKQLKEKSDKISTMASEIKVLQEKNESLMKAKLRFQQQVQHIRSISHTGRERDLTHPAVPPLSSDYKSSHSGKETEFVIPSTQDLSVSMAVKQTSSQSSSEESCPASPQNSRPLTPVNIRFTSPTSPLKLNLPGTIEKSWRRSNEGSPLSPRSQADSEGTVDTQGSLTPRTSALLSPRPYQPQKTTQILRYGRSPEHMPS